MYYTATTALCESVAFGKKKIVISTTTAIILTLLWWVHWFIFELINKMFKV
jgi:hypothetical protein